MILRMKELTKSQRKGRMAAVMFLDKLAEAGGVPRPIYECRPAGTPKKPSHLYKTRVRVPSFLIAKEDQAWGQDMPWLTGQGWAPGKKDAKLLAAQDAIILMEEFMGYKRGGLVDKLEKHMEGFASTEEQKNVPIHQEIPGVTWTNIPVDDSFTMYRPAGRRERISFTPDVIEQEAPFIVAKAMTLLAEVRPPIIRIEDQKVEGGTWRWANINSRGLLKGHKGNFGDASIGATFAKAEMLALMGCFVKLDDVKDPWVHQVIDMCKGQSSFGMAKVFCKLPEHQFPEIKKIVERQEPLRWQGRIQQPNRKQNTAVSNQNAESLESRRKKFEERCKLKPLPADSIQPDYDADVTVLCGGTGSGKTTRFPMRISLMDKGFDTNDGGAVRVVVAQPRRLACQTAARRVAAEHGHEIGTPGCPVGYSIRFESFPSSPEVSRTVDFQTPGVILRRGTNDALMSDITHLVIDEVHERNADVDLLLALAKEAQVLRSVQETLPPLKIIVMSATLDAKKWKDYFISAENVTLLEVPDVRRFPIDIVHLGETGFPQQLSGFDRELKAARGYEYDKVLSRATAELAVHLYSQGGEGSILCFLPGMEEIRAVDNIIQSAHTGKGPTVRYLHSSLSSAEQGKVFEKGRKIILSTNLAETSVTIPDVKIVIDSGRERQKTLMDATAGSQATVVGSQLVTVNISKASAKQRAGRAGRVSAGTCYRLYTRFQHDNAMSDFTKPEMLRMDLSQLVVRSLSMYNPESTHPLSLLLGAPDPPTEKQLDGSLSNLTSQGIVDFDGGRFSGGVMLYGQKGARLTPLGQAISALPAEPRIGRILYVGLALRAIEPALSIAAMLSVPKLFQPLIDGRKEKQSNRLKACSDIVVVLEDYHKYLNDKDYRANKTELGLFRQMTRVRDQLKSSLLDYMGQQEPRAPAGPKETPESNNANDNPWNVNGHRVAAQVGLICCATPHIAHLAHGHQFYATRDVPDAKIHPSSVNFPQDRNAHWYVYHELRQTSAPFMHVTTAASPIELAFFSDWTGAHGKKRRTRKLYEPQNGNWLFVADQWVPVEVSVQEQRTVFVKLKRILMYDMLQRAAQDPQGLLRHEDSGKLVHFVMSAIDQQRVRRNPSENLYRPEQMIPSPDISQHPLGRNRRQQQQQSGPPRRSY